MRETIPNLYVNFQSGVECIYSDGGYHRLEYSIEYAILMLQ